VNPACVAFPALGTTALLWVTDAAALPLAHAILEEELDEIDRVCSRFRDDSELARVNRAAGSTVGVSSTLLDALETAVRAAQATGGLVDPTVGSVLRGLGYDRTFSLVRSRDGRSFRAATPAAAGWTAIAIDREQRTVRAPAGCELDFGATAKALAADRVAKAAAAETGSGILVALGGDIAVGGEAPLNGWPIRIADDHSAALDVPGPTVSVRSGGLASSGTTVRRWRAGDVELHHIVDPRTGRSAETAWGTVSVAAASCVDANIASTAAVVLGVDAPAWLAERGLPARLVDTTGSVHYVAGWPEDAP
jgi:FAD:protein FMN transferase